MRVLLSILAVMSFILGITLNRPFLFIIAGVLALIALGSLVWMWRRRRDKERRRERRRHSDNEEGKEEDLHNLGIMEIRPKASPQEDAVPVEQSPPKHEDVSNLPAEPSKTEREAIPSAAETVASEPGVSESEPATETTTDEPVADQEVEERPDDVPASLSEEAQHVAEAPVAADEKTQSERDAMTPLLRSLQAAVNARTAALLKQEDLALEYEITALVSDRPGDARRKGDVFSTSTPLLTAGMTQRAVTVQRVGDMALPSESLGYYDDPTDVRQVMIAPLKRTDEPTYYFLLADTAREGGFNADSPRELITRYADMMTTLLAREQPGPDESVADTRPRREIIDEEMESARAEDRPLALALVYLNRAEALADEGEQTIASTERTLRRRLEEEAGEGRVERFGELTYGVFYPANGEEAEAWAMQLQSDLNKERGRLEGGISIGVAILSDRHEKPDALRQDATEALREAYTSGTCTILE